MIDYEEFFDRLYGPEGCNFRGKEENLTWTCDGKGFLLSRTILKKMNVNSKDTEEFLKECKCCGAYCDCEIIWNAMDHFLPEDDSL